MHTAIASTVLVPQLPSSATLASIPDGGEGTKAVLKRMRDAVRAEKIHPEVIALARAITARVPNKQWAMEAAAVQQWVRANIRYVRDVHGVETLQAPTYTLRIRSGDCDDHSMLAAALLESIGHPTRFVAIGRVRDQFSHVFVETRIADRWLALETTEPLPFGRAPSFSPITHRLVVHNG